MANGIRSKASRKLREETPLSEDDIDLILQEAEHEDPSYETSMEFIKREGSLGQMGDLFPKSMKRLGRKS